jgi:hypothetical protein
MTPTTPWTASTWYGFCTNTNVKGTNGVNAQSDCWATYFTIGTAADTTSGTVKIGPPDGSANVGTNAYIRLQFSKPVDVTTINSTNVAITTSGNPIPGSWSYNYSGNDVIGVNFSPVNPLPPSSRFRSASAGCWITRATPSRRRIQPSPPRRRPTTAPQPSRSTSATGSPGLAPTLRSPAATRRRWIRAASMRATRTSTAT